MFLSREVVAVAVPDLMASLPDSILDGLGSTNTDNVSIVALIA